MSVNEVTKPPEGFPSIFKGGEGLNEGRGGGLIGEGDLFN